MIHYSSCPLCQSKNIGLKRTVIDHSTSQEEFELYQCGRCQFLFTQNVPDEHEIGKYYESDDYISHSNTSEGLVNKMYHRARDYMLKRKHRLISKEAKGKHLLDIGAGTGYFLNYMKSKGYEAHGVEINEGVRDFAKKTFGLDIREPKDLLEQKLSKYDVVTMWHVLEHLHDPRLYLKSIYKSMNKDAILLIAVPNSASLDAKYYKSFWAAYDIPIHLWHFTPKTLQILVEEMGFRIRSKKMLPLDSFWISIKSENYRGRPLSFLLGGFIGLASFILGLLNTDKASSIIYVIEKKHDQNS